uniref:Uncharacterized protein n=2 Tax=Amphimedon queenslandica TaxID=400682 RepID=A0A1X7TM93_AMPQE
MASNGDAGFKVSVESLHTTRVKEINYDGEEIYEGRPSLSQKLSELAQHVDFREERADDDNDREEGKKKQEEEEEEGVSGPTTKKPSHRWPWEFTHSKLKQALTEVTGSIYAQSVQFEVHKGIEGTNDILSVVVPQELRGRSEVVIFLADRPIKEVVSLDSLLPSCFIELHKQQLMLTPWEQILKSGQNVLFNEELFAQVMTSGWVIEPYRYHRY